MKLCISSFVFGDYIKYIPYYIYSIQRSNPDAFVKIFVKNNLSNEVKNALKLLNNNKFMIVENYFKNIQLKNKIIGGNNKVLRWIIPYEEFIDFDYVYFGDIDFIITESNLLNKHKEHISKINLPFSNAIRSGQKRITGLHFIHVKSYYEMFNDKIKFFIKNPKQLDNYIREVDRDEKFLYKMINEKIDLEYYETIISEDKEYYYRPHNGIHLGLIRVKRKIDKEYKDLLDVILNDKLLKNIIKVCPIPELIDSKYL